MKIMQLSICNSGRRSDKLKISEKGIKMNQSKSYFIFTPGTNTTSSYR